MKTPETGYIVLCQTDMGDMICPSWGCRPQFGHEELELEITNFLIELESLDYDEDEGPKTVDDLVIFATTNEFAFKVEKIEKVVTETTVKLERKKITKKAILPPHLLIIKNDNNN